MDRLKRLINPLKWSSALLLAVITTGCGNHNSNGSGSSDVIKPSVTVTIPATTNPGPTTGPAVNAAIIATFSESMDPATLDTTSFTVVDDTSGSIAVAGSVTYTDSSKTVRFKSTADLTTGNTYTATIVGTGLAPVTDLAGNALAGNTAASPAASDYVWSFIPTAVDVTAPTVTLTIPATTNPGPTAGPAVNAAITATFSESMDPATIDATSFTVVDTTSGSLAVPGTVSYIDSSKTVAFKPDFDFASGDIYTATIAGTGATPVTDLAGNALAGNTAALPAASDYVWSFTPTVVDVTAPTITLTFPADGDIDVALNSSVNATFDEAMDAATIDTANVTLEPTASPGALVTGVVTYDTVNDIATFNPSSNLAASTQYTATVTTAATDLAGNALDTLGGLVTDPWSFTTGTGLAPGAIALGSASTYGTFGGSAGMTNQGTLTVINGNIGTISTTTSTVTGFHDTEGDIFTETGANQGYVNGTIYTCTNSTTGPNSTGVNAAYCALATQSRLDALDAYNTLAGMPSDGVLAGNLAGTTIYPGVYTNSSAVLIQGGDLTLDAQGDANAIFVFQIGSTLTVGGPGAAFPQSIILADGAQAKNVFWQVGSFATINAGGGGTMEGTIISQTGVSFSTAGQVSLVTLNGRALSLGPSVTMVNTVINVPAP